MEQTVTRARAAAVAAGTVMTFASGIVAYGIVEQQIAASVGGGFATLASATLLALAKIRTWTVDTRAERRRLSSAVQHAEDERTRYVAAQGALMQEQARIMRDLEAERSSLRAQSEATRVALIQKLEDERDALKIASYAAGVDHGRRGILDAPLAMPEGKVVPFRGQPPRERSTAHPADQGPEAVRDREAGRP